jgi:hypothetical protein
VFGNIPGGLHGEGLGIPKDIVDHISHVGTQVGLLRAQKDQETYQNMVKQFDSLIQAQAGRVQEDIGASLENDLYLRHLSDSDKGLGVRIVGEKATLRSNQQGFARYMHDRGIMLANQLAKVAEAGPTAQAVMNFLGFGGNFQQLATEQMYTDFEGDVAKTHAGMIGSSQTRLADLEREMQRETEMRRVLSEVAREAADNLQRIADVDFERAIERVVNPYTTVSGTYGSDVIRRGYDDQIMLTEMRVRQMVRQEEIADRGVVVNGVSRYDNLISANPNHYEDRFNELYRPQLSSIRAKMISDPRFAAYRRFSVAGGVGANLASSLGSNAFQFLSGQQRFGDAISGIFSPLTDSFNSQMGNSQSALFAGMFGMDPVSALQNPALQKYVSVSGAVMTPFGALPNAFSFNRKMAMREGLTMMGAQIGGNILVNWIGTSVFSGKDPGAVGMGTSLGSGIGGWLASQGLLKGLGASAGPVGIIGGAILGGLLGGLFGGAKKDPEEEARKQRERQHQERVEELLSRIDKSLRPSSDFYRAIKGDVLYGASSGWYSGRAYSRLGIQGAIGGR